jgi:LacI family transcriptional regulator
MADEGKKGAQRRQRGGRRRNGAPTIADVAREANCSPMTVSRVINGEGNVRDATREQVMAAIAKLNYSPNRAARSLAGGEQLRIALLYANPSSSYLSELLMGALQQASISDVHLVVEQCADDRDEVQVVRRLVEGGINGFVLPSPLCDDQELLELITELGVECVAVGAGEEPKGHSSVVIDDFQAAYDMTRYIIDLGHKRIGFIIGNPQQVVSAKRLAGYRAAMQDAGLEVLDDYVMQGRFSYRSGLDAAEKLLSQDPMPTAIFASNDDMAAATVAVAHRKQLDVPSDVTVCGFDDTAIASTIWPELTTVRQPIRDMSMRSIEVLARELRQRRSGGPVRHEHITLDYRIIRRASDSAPSLVERGKTTNKW